MSFKNNYTKHINQISFYIKDQISLLRNIMFLVALTNEGIAQNFKSIKIDEFNIHSLKVSIITDNFLSNFISELDGFSVVESPLINTPDFRNIIFSKVTYNSKNDSISIFKSTISGRSIYYHINPKGEFFCSTHISLLRTAGVTIEENIEILPEFFIYRSVMPPNSLYKDIYHLFTGGRLCIIIIDGKCKFQSINHYNAPEPNQKIRSMKKSSKIMYDYLSESIERLKPVKDELAVLLSGGKDSSITSNICKKKFGITKSYSSGYPFEDPELNFEKIYALSAAEALGMNHHYYEPSNHEFLAGFLEAIKLSEEPLHHLQSVLFHLLFKNGISKDIKYVVHGQGAGFCFGNVTPYLYWKEKKLTKLLSKKPLKDIFIKISNLGGIEKGVAKIQSFKQILNETNLNYPLYDPKNPLWDWHGFGSVEWICNYFNVTPQNIIKSRYDFIKKFEHRSIYDVWSLYSLLIDEDITLPIWHKLGEENKKILYTPFYDSNVLNYVFLIPWKLKLSRPRNRLRNEICHRGNIPKFIINRPKKSFGIDPKYWGEKEGVFEPLIPIAVKVFNENEIRKMQSSDPKKAMTFWNMLNYAIWKRLCINNEPLKALLEELG
jgi:asparagine synthetase B (glutamine-hydrolysing)